MDGQTEHPDIAAETTARLGQGLAVLATLGEAAARLAAEETRRRERADEIRGQRDQARRASAIEADQLARQAAQLRTDADRRLMAKVDDPDWLRRASLIDLAKVWRTARTRETEFPDARTAAERVEGRLREIYLRPMDLYDQAVSAGTPRAEAMRMAAEQMARTRPARPHTTRRAAALPRGPNPMRPIHSGDAATVHGAATATAAYSELARMGAGGQAAARALAGILSSRPAGEPSRPHRPAGERHPARLAAQATPGGPTVRFPGTSPHPAAGKRAVTLVSPQPPTRRRVR
jgi:hypothetical protein